MSKRIKAGLETQLFTVVAQGSVALQNEEYSPETGMPWFRATYLPAAPYAVGLGEGGRERHIGLYQVDVFTPRGEGDTIARSLAATIKGAFPRGGSIAYQGITIVIERSLPRFQPGGA